MLRKFVPVLVFLGFYLLLILFYNSLGKVQRLNTLYSPEQVHISYQPDTSNLYVTFTTRFKPDECSVDCNGETFTSKEPSHTLRGSYIYKILILKLSPNTSYNYILTCSGQHGMFRKNYSFTSHPGNIDDVSILVLGDWATASTGDLDNPEHTQIPKPNILPMLMRETSNYTSIWHLGDFAYDLYSQNGRVGDNFLNSIEVVAAEKPYMAVVGNHEIPNFFEDFLLRFTSQLYYSFKIGKAYIIAFSTEFDYYAMGNSFPTDQAFFHRLKYKQLHWLEKEFNTANSMRDKYPWLIVMGHRPLYCSLNKDSEMINRVCTQQAPVLRKEYEKLFINAKVDLYLFGHIHLYERSMPLAFNEVVGKYEQNENVFINPEAPIQIIEGVAGNLESEEIVFTVTETPAHWSAVISEKLGYGILHIKNNTHLYYEHWAFGESQWDHLDIDLYPTKTLEDYIWIIKQ
jgi:hypothetical protein